MPPQLPILIFCPKTAKNRQKPPRNFFNFFKKSNFTGPPNEIVLKRVLERCGDTQHSSKTQSRTVQRSAHKQ